MTVQPSAITPELDRFVCEVIGNCLDELVEQHELWPSLCFQAGDEIICEVYSEDGPDQCLETARAAVAKLPSNSLCYAIVYDGFFQIEETEKSAEALICEFADRGMDCAYSAYVPYGFDDTDGFWAEEPVAGGEEPNLFRTLY